MSNRAWTFTNLRDTLILSDTGVWGEENRTEGISVLRSTNFTDEGVLDLSKKSYRKIRGDLVYKKRLEYGDILLEKSGGSINRPVGRVCYFEENDDEIHLFGNFIGRLRTNEKVIISKFLFWYLFYFHKIGKTNQFQKRTTGIRNLEFKNYLNIQIPIPAISQQNRIVEILDQADALRKKRAEADKIAERIIPALFYKMFGDPVRNPMGWEKKPLSKICKWDRAIITSTERNGLPYFGLEHIESESGRILVNESEAREFEIKGSAFLFDNRHILYGKLRPYLNKVALPEFKGCCSTELVPLLPNDERPREFIAALLRLPLIVSIAMNSNKGSRMPRTDMKLLLNLEVIDPIIERQKKFSETYKSINSARNFQEIIKIKIESVFNSLLNRAFSGELTAKWREAHMEELLREMEIQVKYLNEVKE